MATISGLDSCLFQFESEKVFNRCAKAAWDSSMSGLHQQALRENNLMQDYMSPSHLSEAPWERLRMQELFVAISTMAMEGNYVCKKKFLYHQPKAPPAHLFWFKQVSEEMKRGIQYSIKLATRSIFVTASSANDSVRATWDLQKMVCRLCKIKRLHWRGTNTFPDSSSGRFITDPFYDTLQHQLIGVG